MQSAYEDFPAGVTSKPASSSGIVSASVSRWTEEHDANVQVSRRLARNDADAVVDDNDEYHFALEHEDVSTTLRTWSESPESPPRHQRVNTEENWDDDFVDNADSPIRSNVRRKQRLEEDHENWDAEFGIAVSTDSPGLVKSGRSRANIQWDTSEDDYGDDLNPDFDRNEEEKTVTARRRKPLGTLNSEISPIPATAPPIPSQDTSGLYQSLFTRSPTHSAFSIPTTSGRDSISYSSTAHLALRRTYSTESSPAQQQQDLSHRFPAATPITPQKERRRLRKKSRPPHLDASIMELEDRSGPEVPAQAHAGMPDSHPSTPPPRSSTEATSPNVASPNSTFASASPSSKSVLLSRIGSVKRWSVSARRKHATPSRHRNDTGPASTPPSSYSSAVEVEGERHDNNKTPRPRSFAAPSSDTNPDTSTSTADRKRRGLREGPQATTPKSSLRGKARSESKPVPIKIDPLQLAIPGQAPPPSSSVLIEPDLTASPRKVLKTLGYMLRSTSGKSKSESLQRSLGKEKDAPDAVLSAASTSGTPNHLSSLLLRETPSQTRSRIAHQLPSVLKDHSVFPRHASGPVFQEGSGSSRFSSSLSSRSISASTSGKSNEDLSRFGEGSLRKEGYRGFMGSIRRLSLTNGQKRHRKPLSCEPSPVPSDISSSCAASDVLVPVDRRPFELHSPTPSVASSTGLALNPLPKSLSAPIDAASPALGSQMRDKESSPCKSGDLILSHSKSSSFAVSSSSLQHAARMKIAAAQAASLGRASPIPGSVFRRSSLGDLKIPSRIRSAQDGLKKDLDRVREFAAHVEQMKDLRTSYLLFISQIRALVGTLQSPNAGSRPPSQANSMRANYNGLMEMIQGIDSKYVVAWECADLLIELGTGKAPDPMQPIRLSGADQQKKRAERTTTLYIEEGFVDLSLMIDSCNDRLQEQSVNTISTGRGDLGKRQLLLLKEMLNNADSAKEGTSASALNSSSSQQQQQHPLESGLDEGMTSSWTLQTEESEQAGSLSPVKKRRRNSRMGLLGIREMLRSIKRSHLRFNQLDGAPSSTTTISTESSFDHEGKLLMGYPYNSISGLPTTSQPVGRPRAKTSSGVDTTKNRASIGHFPDSLALGDYSGVYRASPRRPSLASLFRMVQKHKSPHSGSVDKSTESGVDAIDDVAVAVSGDENASSVAASEKDDSDSEWDRIDAMSEMDIEAAENVATGNPTVTPKRRRRLRLSSPLPSRPSTPKQQHPYSSSQLSFGTSEQYSGPTNGHGRTSRLSNNVNNENLNLTNTPSASRRPPTHAKTGSTTISPHSSRRKKEKQFSSIHAVQNKPSKKAIPSFDDVPPSPQDPKLAMTPENIKPLLENARVVTARLHDCITETRDLIDRLVANLAADTTI